MEEGTELLRRLRKAWGLDLPAAASTTTSSGGSHSHQDDPGPLPMFTSCEWLGGGVSRAPAGTGQAAAAALCPPAVVGSPGI